MRKLARHYLAFINWIDKLVGLLLAAMLATMTVLISWQVFARFVVGDALTFSEEVSRFLMIWLTLLGAAYAVRRGSLLAVDILPELLHGRVQRIIKITAHIVSSIFYVVLIVYGWDIATTVSYQSAPATGVSMMWPMLALSAGGALMLLNTVATVLEESMFASPRGAHETHLVAEAEG